MGCSPSHPHLLPDDAAGPDPSGRGGRLVSMFLSRGGWALGDQAVVSGGNFLTTVLLARYWHAEPGTYGAVALILSVMQFLNGLQGSLVAYPLTLGVAGTDDPSVLRRLSARGLAMTGAIAPLMAIALLVACLSVSRPALLPWVIAALVLWQGQETLRRALLARLRHRDAIPGDAISYVGQALLILALARGGMLTIELVFAGIAVTSGLAIIVQALQLGIRPRGACGPDWSLISTADEWWRISRWLLLGGFVNIGVVYLTPWTLQAFHGEEHVARYAAVATLLNMTNPLTFSIANIVVPAVVAAYAGAMRDGAGATAAMAAVRRVALRYATFGGMFLLPYYALLLIVPGLALRLFYGADSPYLSMSGELRMLVLCYAAVFGVYVVNAALNGLGRTQATFVTTIVGAAATTVITMPVAIAYGVRGAIFVGPLAMGVQLIVATVIFLRSTDPRRASSVRTMPMPSSIAPEPAVLAGPARVAGEVA